MATLGQHHAPDLTLFTPGVPSFSSQPFLWQPEPPTWRGICKAVTSPSNLSSPQEGDTLAQGLSGCASVSLTGLWFWGYPQWWEASTQGGVVAWGDDWDPPDRTHRQQSSLLLKSTSCLMTMTLHHRRGPLCPRMPRTQAVRASVWPCRVHRGKWQRPC